MFKKLSLFVTAVLLALVFQPSAKAQQKITPFKNGDKVAFVGNSITDGGHYHSYIWLYYMTHFPNTRITCYNIGIGGDAAKNLAKRFDDDVLTRKPTVITLTWGMNDSGYFEWFRSDAQESAARRLDTSYKYYHVMEAKMKALPNVRNIIIASSPYDETTTSNPNNLWKGKSGAMLKIAEFQEAAAKKNNWGFIDLNRPMTAINQREQAKNPSYSLTPNDRVHPDNDGHLVMAYFILKAQGLAGSVVADVAVNAKDKKVEKSVNSKISDVVTNGNNISFNYLANSLPYPIDTISRGWGFHKKQSDALKVIPFMQDFNREMLTVKNLHSGKYQLKIDDEKIGTWSADELAGGINLAEQTYTPQYQQAIQIRELNEERLEIEHRFRIYAFMQYNVLMDRGLLHADNRVAMDTINAVAKKEIFVAGNRGPYLVSQYKAVRQTWQQEMDVLVNQIYTINKPVTHKITLTYIN